MATKFARFTAQLLASGLVDIAARAEFAMRPAQLTPPRGVHGQEEPEPMSLPIAAARTAAPPAAAVGLTALATLTLEAARPALALRLARFANLSLSSLLAGNGASSVLFVHPALGALRADEWFRSEQQLTRRYPGVMRMLLPATVASGLSVLWLLRDRRTASFRLTLVGTAFLLGVLGTTAREIPLNEETLKASPDAPPADWAEKRADWNRFNRLRTAAELAAWSCFCLGALAEAPR
jgi:uncharacterized membrane protein